MYFSGNTIHLKRKKKKTVFNLYDIRCLYPTESICFSLFFFFFEIFFFDKNGPFDYEFISLGVIGNLSNRLYHHRKSPNGLIDRCATAVQLKRGNCFKSFNCHTEKRKNEFRYRGAFKIYYQIIMIIFSGRAQRIA